MILHLVTDRRRLASGASPARAVACLLAQVRHAVDAGIDVVQVREHDLDGGALARLTADVLRITRGSRTRVVVNERVDVALAVHADGVHLRGDSVDAHRLRPLVPPTFLIGRSVHSVEEARAAGPVDYLVAGTVWATPSKRGDPALLGPDGLRAIVASTRVPVLAIGGVDVTRIGTVARAGAAGIAAIGAWMDASASECRATPLADRTAAYRLAFDAANMGDCSPR